ncbi:uncharacterized protein LOC110035392 [Phalaenopsis equestris]|uniref:uncharacterized protein LOC110035392 n=1 Tax=Phalaenopsis equestris TaxID=78828 RepID=UPI0009E3C8F8|nr:uncharacterized protein LOC110035392 [Phalaenopsis equestris]
MASMNPFQSNKTPFFQGNQSSSSSSSSTAMARSCPQNEEKGKSKMNSPGPISLPDHLLKQKSKMEWTQSGDGINLEGVITNIKQILEILEALKEFSKVEDNPKSSTNTTKIQQNLHVRSPYLINFLYVLNMLDDIRSRIKHFLHRCGHDRTHSNGLSPRSPKPRPFTTSADENQKLRCELSASLTARRSLERMFSSLGQEKEMIATELARKVQEVHDMEELVSDLRAYNNKLTEKLNDWRQAGIDGGLMEMKERNRELSEKFLKVLDECKMAKRRLREVKEENERVREEVEVLLERMKIVRGRGRRGVVEEEEMEEMEEVLEKLAKVGLPSCSN